MDAKTLSMLLMPLVAVFILGSDGTPAPGLYDVHVVGRICPDTAPYRYLTRTNITDPDYGRTVVVDGPSSTDQHWSLVNSTTSTDSYFFIFNTDLNEALEVLSDSEIGGDGRVVSSTSVTAVVHGAAFINLGDEFRFEFAEAGGNGDPSRGLIRHVDTGLVLQHRDANSTVAEGVFAVEHASGEGTTTVTEGFCTCTYPPASTPGRWWRYFD